MITGTEVLSDLNSILKKVEYLQTTFPKNDLWPKVKDRLKELVLTIKKDQRVFGYE